MAILTSQNLDKSFNEISAGNKPGNKFLLDEAERRSSLKANGRRPYLTADNWAIAAAAVNFTSSCWSVGP